MLAAPEATQARERLLAMFPAALRLDTADNNPAGSEGALTFDMASALLGGLAGAGAKSALKATGFAQKAGRIATVDPRLWNSSHGIGKHGTPELGQKVNLGEFGPRIGKEFKTLVSAPNGEFIGRRFILPGRHKEPVHAHDGTPLRDSTGNPVLQDRGDGKLHYASDPDGTKRSSAGKLLGLTKNEVTGHRRWRTIDDPYEVEVEHPQPDDLAKSYVPVGPESPGRFPNEVVHLDSDLRQVDSNGGTHRRRHPGAAQRIRGRLFRDQARFTREVDGISGADRRNT
ncbi:hypothetical protein I6B53_01890 [Schaalia sp. 19OD2882]|uniref:hypothetical protein n=1 Tax=Schaalia sp. 19OD2882 TaxID=2794089 RepID=UPI001C1F14C0|nr:hypothetical protein [Schaalia sp. 19OD2882]QWW19900.1 hypothetical protein I6B53_01890 [Schaalia sp. 19OD2882]